MQIINKTVSCMICGCICLPDSYHCPKCGTSLVISKERDTNSILSVVNTEMSRINNEEKFQALPQCTVFVDMIEKKKAIIILRN
jgi:hypothetical protein